jgi:hypothetical protein
MYSESPTATAYLCFQKLEDPFVVDLLTNLDIPVVHELISALLESRADTLIVLMWRIFQACTGNVDNEAWKVVLELFWIKHLPQLPTFGQYSLEWFRGFELLGKFFEKKPDNMAGFGKLVLAELERISVLDENARGREMAFRIAKFIGWGEQIGRAAINIIRESKQFGCSIVVAAIGYLASVEAVFGPFDVLYITARFLLGDRDPSQFGLEALVILIEKKLEQGEEDFKNNVLEIVAAAWNEALNNRNPLISHFLPQIITTVKPDFGRWESNELMRDLFQLLVDIAPKEDGTFPQLTETQLCLLETPIDPDLISTFRPKLENWEQFQQ